MGKGELGPDGMLIAAVGLALESVRLLFRGLRG
jgi:hypothetical protein